MVRKQKKDKNNKTNKLNIASKKSLLLDISSDNHSYVFSSRSRI